MAIAKIQTPNLNVFVGRPTNQQFTVSGDINREWLQNRHKQNTNVDSDIQCLHRSGWGDYAKLATYGHTK